MYAGSLHLIPDLNLDKSVTCRFISLEQPKISASALQIISLVDCY